MIQAFLAAVSIERELEACSDQQGGSRAYVVGRRGRALASTRLLLTSVAWPVPSSLFCCSNVLLVVSSSRGDFGIS
jgi:hypothetical protein